jgi:hypothetical protein
MAKTIEVPLSLLLKMTEAGEAFRSLEDELDDFLIAENKPLLTRLERARRQHQSGRLRPFSQIRRVG